MGAHMLNEFQLIIRELPLCRRPAPQIIEKGKLVKCIVQKGKSWEFNLDSGQKYRVADCQKGGISIHGLSPDTYYDARRFIEIGDDPFLAVNIAPIQSFGRIAA